MDELEITKRIQENTKSFLLLNDNNIFDSIVEDCGLLFSYIDAYFSISNLKKYSTTFEMLDKVVDTKIDKLFKVGLCLDSYKLYYNPLLFYKYSMKDILSILVVELEYLLSALPLVEQSSVFSNTKIDQERLLSLLLRQSGNEILNALDSVEDSEVLSKLKEYISKNKENKSQSSMFQQGIDELLKNDAVKNKKLLDELLEMMTSFDSFEGDSKEDNEETYKTFMKKTTAKIRGNERSTSSFDEEESVKVTKRELSWSDILTRLIGSVVMGKRHTKTRLNRRQPLRCDLSGELSDRKVHVIAAVDTSYSMDHDKIEKALSEVYTLKCKFDFKLTLVQCDSEIKDIKDIKNKNDIPTSMIGRGGTSFEPVIKYLNSHRKLRDSVLVYFTDGEGDKEISKPMVRKVIWVLINPLHGNKISCKDSYGIVVTAK